MREASKAIIHLSDEPGEDTRLKRLALLFDEIHFIRPSFATISEERVDEIERGAAAGEQMTIALDLLTDIHHSLQLVSLNPELEETLAAMKEAGVAFDRSDLVSDRAENVEYRRWLTPFVLDAIRDNTWNVLTETTEEAYSQPKISTIHLAKLDSGEALAVTGIDEPAAVERITHLAAEGFLANSSGGFPLFDEKFRPLLAYRYERYKATMSGQPQLGVPTSNVEDHRARFGATAFDIANSVFSSSSVDGKSVDEILRYRSEMDLARRQFLSNDLMEISDLIADNPWGPQAADELNKYIDGKLTADIAAFDSESIGTWEKLYGALAGRAVGIAQGATIGGGLGGVTGNLLPNTSFWAMLMGGLLVDAAKEGPGIAQDVLDAWRSARESARTGIAYIAKF